MTAVEGGPVYGQYADATARIGRPASWVFRNIAEEAQKHSAVDIVHAAAILDGTLAFLQVDTFDEFYLLKDSVLHQESDETDSEQRIDGWNGVPFELAPNLAVFLVTSNVFNRVDEFFERAVGASILSGDELLRRMVQKTPVAVMGSARYSFHEVTDAIVTVCQFLNIDAQRVRADIDDIVASAKEGAAWVSQSNALQETVYSVSDGCAYRRNTVGRYARLLSVIMDLDVSTERLFVKGMAETQIDDDIVDIGEDVTHADGVFVHTQPNPFIPWLSVRGLLVPYLMLSPVETKKTEARSYFGGRLLIHNDIDSGDEIIANTIVQLRRIGATEGDCKQFSRAYNEFCTAYVYPEDN